MIKYNDFADLSYFHVLKIVENLKQSEADGAKNIFGQYSSQRIKVCVSVHTCTYCWAVFKSIVSIITCMKYHDYCIYQDIETSVVIKYRCWLLIFFIDYYTFGISC